MNDWVSADEEWPKENGKYLVTRRIGLLGKHSDVTIAYKHDHHWSYDADDYRNEIWVTHWMNLPEPAKEK